MQKNNKFISYGYSSFLQGWQDYYKNNFITFNEELEALKVGLDDVSKEEIDNFIEHIIHKLKTPTQHYLIKQDYLFNNHQRSKIKQDFLSKDLQDFYRQKYKIPTDFLIQPSVFKYHNGLKFVPKEKLVSIKNHNILDVGAYYGDSAINFMKYKPQYVYAFEPNSVNYNFLLQTIDNNNFQNKIIPINQGLYENSGNYTFSYNSFSRPNLGVKIAPHNNYVNKSEVVRVTTIDRYVQEYKIQNIAVIKIDVEGVEYETILGAKNTIKKASPILLIAIYHNAEEFFNVKNFLTTLDSRYNFLVRSLDHYDILKELYLIAYI